MYPICDSITIIMIRTLSFVIHCTNWWISCEWQVALTPVNTSLEKDVAARQGGKVILLKDYKGTWIKK